ncbi:Glutathione S-transferase, domain-containing protein [Cladophialophora immunda]|nr:Glutathione S-transferase, domain-containing protein [Cladophialophora immunda]
MQITLQPLTLYSTAAGPNPYKVAIVLEELGLPYETQLLDLSDVKKKPFTDLNPNGRVPALTDPNRGLTIWESGAIIQYLVEVYDAEEKITYHKAPEKFLLNQWLHFQVSGQGPYYGQCAWFTHYHHENIQSAKDRYLKEVERVISVLDCWLQKHDFLVGDKCTYADLSFVTWAILVPWLDKEKRISMSQYSAYSTWLEKLVTRPAVRKVLNLLEERRRHL